MIDYDTARKEIITRLASIETDPLSLYTILYEITQMTALICEGYHKITELQLKQAEDIAIAKVANNELVNAVL